MTASPDFSSDTLTDLQTAQRELAELRAEVAQLCDSREAQHPDVMHCSGCAMVSLIVGDLRRILAAAAPVDGAE